MKFSGERFVPNETDYELAVEHLHRYYAILDLVKDKIVLDAASGEGYGTFILSQHARHVTGVDYSSEAVVHAKTTYANDNIKFVEASVEKLPVEDNSIDIVVSFETIEHVTEDIQHSFLREIKRVLKPDGILIMSTPDKYVYSDMNDFNNPFHKKEFYKDEFYKFLVNYFPNIELFVQKFEVSSFILNNKDKAAKNVQIDKNNLLRNAKYLVAICSEVVIKDININSFIPDSTNRLETLVRRIVTVQNEIEERNKHLKYLDQVIEEKNSIIENKDSKIKEIKQLLETETTKSKDNIKEIKYLLENEKTKNDINIKLIDMLNEEKQKLYSQVEFQNKNLNQALSTISGMEERFQEQNEKLVQALLKISEQEEEICKINEQLQANIEILDSYENLHDQMNNKIHEYNDHNNSIGNDNIEKDQIIKNQIGHINMLLEQERKLNNILQSGGWNALSKYYKIRDLILPDNSKRKLLAKLTFKTIKNPGKILSKINKKNIKKLNYYLKTENPELIADRVDNFIHRHSENENQSEFKVFNDIHTFEKLIFNKEALPQVSIIIPVYNQWNYTYACLKSILENTNSNISYEIIIADDMSTDQTININNYVENITIIRDGQNRGFLLNCNNAAKQAQGKYIFFLNNDTNVQTNWLRTLVELMENDESIGMAGSKLVYPDGRQQEAGGIIWNDASGWNYGRLDDPEKPEYNYVKEVDYISGAAIMIRSDLWKQIGGFDERYVPAYFEDSDLAFEIRNHGYKVVLQPKSVIIHFEGISHGTDVKSGVKSYQVKNKEKFIDKWQHILMKDHFNNADHVFFARDRSKNKKTILVIDHYVPHYDKDAGSRTVFQYLQLFVEMGFNVKFVGDNYFKHEPYTSTLEEMGIEVLYGNWYAKHFKDWLKINGKYIDFTYLNRPHISINYIDLIKKYTKSKTFYYGHDLHYLREIREYQITGNQELLSSSQKWREIESKLINDVDVVYYPSIIEVNELKNHFPNQVIKAIPAYIYYTFDMDPLVSYNERNDLLFVGGFGHKPNIDAVLWFASEIFPRIVMEIPGVKWYIVGSNPPELIKKLNCENIIVTGFVSDPELESFYKNCKIVVVPLRYGAGVKGKVIEAMYHRNAIITTKVGSEGLPDAADFLIECDEAATFAETVVELYKDNEMLSNMAMKSQKFVEKYYSKESVMNIIHRDFTHTGITLK